jgi:Mn2+/Fe2+ NRAMP family transporter
VRFRVGALLMLKLPLIILGALFVATLVAAALAKPDDEARAAAARRASERAESPGGIWIGILLGIPVFMIGLVSLANSPLALLIPAGALVAALFTVGTTSNPRHRRVAAGLLITVAVCVLIFGTCVAIVLSNLE